MIWALGGAAFVVSLLAAWWTPPTVDEAWMLVVARRLLAGERPYRDVFFGAGPLALWLLAGLFRLTRPQGLVVRTVAAGYVAAEATLLAAVVTTLSGPPPAAVAAVTTLLAVGGLHLFPHNHYGHLTHVATLAATLGLVSGHPVTAGAAAGVAVLGKYPQGLVAVAGTVTVAATRDGSEAAVAAAVAAAAVGVAAALVLGSDLRWFYRRAVTNKVGYVRTGRAGPWAVFRRASRRPWTEAARWLPTAVAAAAVATAPVAVVAVAVVAAAGGDDVAVVGGLPAAVAVAAVFPRFDGPHAVGAAPLTVAAATLAGLAAGVGAGWWWAATAAATPLLAVGVAARIRSTRSVPHRRDVPALRGLAVTPLRGGVWPDETGGLPRRVFVLRPDAAMVYAAGGVSNPTPFDYPMASTFGPRGQEEVLAAVDAGMAVCVGWPDPPGLLAPRRLLAAVEDLAGAETRLGRLVVRRRPPPSPPRPPARGR